MPSRPRAAFAVASRIWVKDIPLPFLLASKPLSDRVPRCTRTVTWSPSTTYSSLSPGLIRNALRIFPGMVVCPLLVTVECGIADPYFIKEHYFFHYALLLVDWQD